MTRRTIKKTRKKDTKKSLDKKRERALAAIEKIRKAKYKDIEGKKDVAINHDYYLDEAYSAIQTDAP